MISSHLSTIKMSHNIDHFKKTSQVVGRPETTSHNIADDLVKEGPPLNLEEPPRDASHSIEHNLENKHRTARQSYTDRRLEETAGSIGKKYHRHPHDIADDPRLDIDQVGRQSGV